MMARTLIHMHMCNWLDEWAQTSVVKLDISLGYNINLFSMGDYHIIMKLCLCMYPIHPPLIEWMELNLLCILRLLWHFNL